MKLGRTYPTLSTGMAIVDKLTLIEAFITALLGITCLLARSPMHASKTKENVFAWSPASFALAVVFDGSAFVSVAHTKCVTGKS